MRSRSRQTAYHLQQSCQSSLYIHPCFTHVRRWRRRWRSRPNSLPAYLLLLTFGHPIPVLHPCLLLQVEETLEIPVKAGWKEGTRVTFTGKQAQEWLYFW